MPDTGNQPAPYFADEQSPHQAATYLYVLHHENGTAQFWTTWKFPIFVANLPANLQADDPQEFTPMQVHHEAISINSRFEDRSTMLSVQSNVPQLRKFFSIAAAVRLNCYIYRVSGHALKEGLEIDASLHAVIIESGFLSEFGFQENIIAAKLTPPPLATDRAVPRFFFGRLCNHALYGVGCNLDKDDFSFETDIVSVNPAQREIVVTGKKVGAASDYFTGGYFAHPETGMNFTIAWSAFDGLNTKFKLWNWHPELAAAQDLTAYAGCKHTTADCTNRFGNQANFGGFPHVPAKNPVTNGVQ